MDQPIPRPEAEGPPAIGPHLRLHPESDPPAFIPLRLVLQSAGSAIEVTRNDVIVGRHTGADIRLPLSAFCHSS